MNKQVGVIILNWNGAELMRKYLPSVVANTNSEIADVIVADNGSTDKSLEVLAGEFPTVKVLKFDKNYGFAEGYNKAIAASDYEYVVLLNSDVRVPAGWLEPMYEYCESNPEVGACQPKLLSDVAPEKFEYAGASGGFIDKHGYPYCRGRLFESVENDEGQYDDVRDILWATGAALFVRKSVYENAGGLDSKFFAHMEEIDLCWRIHLLGKNIKVIPKAIAYHYGGASLPASNPRKTYLNFRNNLLLLHKNLPEKYGRRLLFIRRLYDTLAFFMALAKFNFGDAKAILKAHRDFRSMRKNYTHFPERNLLEEMPECRVNIIFDYFMFGKKTFTKLFAK